MTDEELAADQRFPTDAGDGQEMPADEETSEDSGEGGDRAKEPDSGG
jgi:hypothetical protein